MDPFDTSSYLNYSLKLNSAELRLRKFYDEWLPEEIIDTHAHNNEHTHVETIEERFARHMMSTFPYFSIEQSQQAKKLLFPNHKIRTLRFSHVIKGINFRAANEYLLNKTPPEDRVALLGIPDDTDYTITMMQTRYVAGLKMYYLYFNPAAKTIYEYFPPEVLEVAQDKEIPIILHLPKLITLCSEDLKMLMRDFPKLKVVLAHLGLPHLPVPQLQEAYDMFAEYPNIAMDTAMIPSHEVVSMAISSFGAERILFGSDEPLHLIRSSVYEHPTLGQRLATEYPYHWVDPSEHLQYKHLAKGSVHSIWQALDAIRWGLESVFPSSEIEKAKWKIFHDNAREVFKF